IHIIGIVSWFAGLLYIVRLFIYHTEAGERDESERRVLQPQLIIMQRRLWYGITWPAMVLTVGAGLALATLGGFWTSPWLHAKLTLVLGMVMYHLVCGRIHRRQRAGEPSWSSMALRVWNELATVALVVIVLLAVL